MTVPETRSLMRNKIYQLEVCLDSLATTKLHDDHRYPAHSADKPPSIWDWSAPRTYGHCLCWSGFLLSNLYVSVVEAPSLHSGGGSPGKIVERIAPIRDLTVTHPVLTSRFAKSGIRIPRRDDKVREKGF
jgi:hypothetical protein